MIIEYLSKVAAWLFFSTNIFFLILLLEMTELLLQASSEMGVCEGEDSSLQQTANVEITSLNS